MLAGWIRQAAFWASLLLLVCIVERADFSSRGASGGTFASIGAVHTLTIAPFARDKTGAEAVPVVTKIYKVEADEGEKNPGQAHLWLAPFYQLAAEVAGQLGDAQAVRLSAGTYVLVTRAPGYVRVASRLQLSADQEVRPELLRAGKLAVRVLAEKDGELTPLAGATVLVGEREELAHGNKTDAKGAVDFNAVPEGPLRVRIYAPGFEPYESVAEGELLVRLRPASTLRVLVTENGKPAPGARVTIGGVRLWPARTADTGEDGRVNMTGLSPGGYALFAEKDALISSVNRAVNILDEPGTLEVELKLLPGKFMDVWIREVEAEKGIPGARVSVNSGGLGEFSRHFVSDGQGRLRVGPLSDMSAILRARASGYVARVVPLIDPEAEAPEPLRTIALERAGRIEGRVVDAGGFPVAGATVEVVGTDRYGMPVSVSYRSEAIADAHFDWAMSSDNVLIPAGELGVMLGPVPPIPLGEVRAPSSELLTTDEKGRFSVSDVPAGEIVVVGRHPDHMDGKSAVLRLSPGQTLTTEVVLGKGIPLKGRVVDHRDFPVPDARVRILGRGYDRRVSAESDGTFYVGAAPEEVSLSVARMDQPLRVLLFTEVAKAERMGEILLRLPVPREAARVQVVDESGQGVELAQIALTSLESESPLKMTRFTGARGETEFFEARGLRVRLSTSAPGFVTEEAERVLDAESKITLVRAVTAKGRVTGVRGRLPAAGAEIRFESGRVTRRAVADQYGEYHLSGLPEGRGALSASHEEYGKGKLAVTVKRPQTDTPFEMPDLDLSPAVTVSGRVVVSGGQSVAGILISTERLSPFVRPGGSFQILGTTDERGVFEVSVSREKGTYLYGALPGRAYGFSDELVFTDVDELSGVELIIDHLDVAPPDESGSVLIGLLDEGSGLVIYAVAEGSQAQAVGLLEEDTLLRIDGTTPRDLADARALLCGTVGTDVRLSIRRGRQEKELLVPREAFLRSGF